MPKKVAKFSPHIIRQFLILSLCRFAEPVALTSVSPYLYYMIKHFGVPTTDIAFYVGITFGCFSLSQFLTGIFWGRTSDKFGRKPIVLMGMSGTLISILIFGFSANIYMAIFARCFSGLVNGNVGILRTMVAEMVPEKELQPRAFSVMPLIWSVGCILGPAIGGFLADPIANHPNWFKGIPAEIFKRFPFALPNLVIAVVFVGSLSTGYLYLDETLEQKKRSPDRGRRIGRKITNFFSSKPAHDETKDGVDEASPLLPGDSTPFAADEEASAGPVAPREIEPDAATPPLRAALTFQSTVNIIAYSMLALHMITFDQMLPVLMSYPRENSSAEVLKFAGGFGMPSSRVGIFFSLFGIIGMFLQFFVFPPIANKLGPLRCFRISSITFPITYILTPFTLILPLDKQEPAIFLLLLTKCVGGIFAFPCSTMLLTNSSPSLRLLGTLNGIAVSLAALGRALGPAIGGLAFSWGQTTGYGIIPWFFLSGIAALSVVPTMLLTEGEGFTS